MCLLTNLHCNYRKFMCQKMSYFSPFLVFYQRSTLDKKQQKTTTELLFYSELQIKIEGLKKAKVKCIYKQVFFPFFKIDFKPPPPLPNPQIPPPHKKNNDDGIIMTGVIYGQAPVCLSVCQAHSGQLTANRHHHSGDFTKVT